MSSELSRRDFLKLTSLLPLLHLNIPYFYREGIQSSEGQKRPNIFILVFDALTATQMSLYGYRRNTTPNITRLAERATIFHAHQSAGSFTSAGTASLLTGTYPWTHRAIHMHSTVKKDLAQKNIFSLFGQAGYTRSAYSHNLLVTSLLHQFRNDLEIFTRTRDLCLVDDQFSDLVFPGDFNVAFWSEWLTLRGGEAKPASLFLSLVMHFFRYVHKQDLQVKYGELFPRGIPNLFNLFFILEDAIDWIIRQLDKMPQPFLAYFHLLPPHEPYTTRRDFVDSFKDGWKAEPKPDSRFSEDIDEPALVRNRREYDEYLAYADAEFGRLLDFMLKNDVLEHTCFIFTSDHGELFERGILGHVTPALYQPLIQVPLLISMPGQSQRKDIYSPTNSVDLLPTLLRMIGQNIPDWCEGQPLPGFQAKETEHSIYSMDAKTNPKYAPLRKGSVTLRNGDYKLISYIGYKKSNKLHELYDLANDPEERVDLFPTNPSLALDLQHELEEKLSAVNEQYASTSSGGGDWSQAQ